MIINNLNFVGVVIAPYEADAPLIVYPNTILAFAIATQRLKPITGCDSQVL